ncbi:MAG: nitroreductase family protein [Armatimonadota bacterium]|nr:nitroreductase family protein [Armatimonadota bacterium]
MRAETSPEVDYDRCVRCGRCVAVCAADLLEMGKEGPEPIGFCPCFVCGHCVAVCPTEAISHPDMPPEGFVELAPAEEAMDVEQLWDLLRRRRSVRQYTDEQVPEDVVMELIEAATLAPSALNEQEWHFTVIRDPARLQRIRRRIVAIYSNVVKMLKSRINRLTLRLMIGSEAMDLLEEAEPVIRRIVEAYDEHEDRILWDAPTLIVVHSPEGDPTAAESSHYATANMMLLATAMGLGTCLIGFVTEVAERDERLKQYLRVPEHHHADAALVVGYPDVQFLKSVAKREPPIEII